ncbi:MAG: universal stress protein, partial [Pseudomonadota bacterium]
TVKTENHLTQKILGTLQEVAAGAPDIECRVATGKAGMTIVETARDVAADLIIVGAHAPGTMDYFLGSTASRVTRRAACSVYVMR